jgi:hypothetical protein
MAAFMRNWRRVESTLSSNRDSPVCQNIFSTKKPPIKFPGNNTIRAVPHMGMLTAEGAWGQSDKHAIPMNCTTRKIISNVRFLIE